MTDVPRPLPRPSPGAQLRLIRRMTNDPQPVLDEMSATYGPISGIGFGPTRGAIIGDPAALREMFATSNDSFRWGHRFNVIGFVVGDSSMIVSDGEDHKRRRSSVQAAFSRRRLNRWIPMIVEQCDAAIDQLLVSAGADDEPVDLYPVGRDIVFAVVVRALFGERLAARTGEIAPLFETSQAYLESPAMRQIPHPLPFTARARVRADRKAIDAIIDTEIVHRRAHHDPDSFDALEALVANSELTDAEIRDQVVTLIGAGYHTTAASLAWILWRATTTPGLWDRLRAEADDGFGPAGPDISTPHETTFASLELSDRVMRETLRLHPPGVVGLREAARDLTLGGHLISKGTMIVWSPHLAGRDPDAWPEPLRFDPDRFLDPTAEQKELADTAWVPFGRGSRNCIGFALAQMELTLITSRLAQRLDLAPVDRTVPGPTGMVVNRPDGGVPMRIAPRDAPPR